MKEKKRFFNIIFECSFGQLEMEIETTSEEEALKIFKKELEKELKDKKCFIVRDEGEE